MKAAGTFGLNPEIETVFLFGGSQGSIILNKTISAISKQLTEEGIQLLWQTGKMHIDHYSTYDSDWVRVVPFIDNMADAYSLSDLVVSRAGAITLSEITVCGKPSILVPLVYAAGDHQTKNAQTLVSVSASKMIPEKDLSPEMLVTLILSLMRNKTELKQMAECARLLGKPNATEVIVDNILGLARS